MTPGAFAQNQTVLSEADALFAALDQAPMGDGVDRWFAAVLRIYADERDWWVDVAASSDSSISVIVRLSLRFAPGGRTLRRDLPSFRSCAGVDDRDHSRGDRSPIPALRAAGLQAGGLDSINDLPPCE
jgi:hypothetical protein